MFPEEVVKRAALVLDGLHENRSNLSHSQRHISEPLSSEPARIFVDPRTNLIMAKLEGIQFDDLTAKRAYDLLWECREILEKKG